MEKGFDVFLIDPFEKKISVVYYDGNFKSIYSIIDCKLFDATPPFNNRGDAVVVDDVGIYKKEQKFFSIKGYSYPLAGKGIVIGCDFSTGDDRPPFITLEDLVKNVRWLGNLPPQLRRTEL